VAALLRETGVDPASIILEITEGVLLDDGGSTLSKLQELANLGLRLAIDDFGTGYSALSYLQRFPIDVLKIDRSFIQSLGQGGARDALVRAIVALGQALNLRLVAEGIESPEQQQHLAALGCEFGQGYWFGHAQPREDFERLLEAQAACRAA
jgi:EAL domain-containing protein (putative c-di-GMP-specific phosphodiesterase class I)